VITLGTQVHFRNDKNTASNVNSTPDKGVIGTFLFKGYSGFISYISKLSIRRRLIVFFLLLSIIPITFVGLFSFYSSKKTITNKITKYSLESLVQAATTLELQVQKYEDLSLHLQVNFDNITAIKDFINNGSKASAEKLRRLFNDSLGFDADVHYIMLASLKGHSYLGTSSTDLSDNFANLKESDVLKEALEAEGQLCWGVIGTDLALVRIIYDMSTREPISAFTVGFFGSNINRLINASNDDTPTMSVENLPYSLLLKLDGKILSSPKTEELGLKITDFLEGKKINDLLQLNESKNGFFSTHLKNKNVLVTYSQIPSKDWYILGIAPHKYLFKETTMVGIFTFLIIFMIILIAVVISYWVSLSISIPLEQVKGAMAKARDGDLTVKVEIDTQDELSELGNSFNLMTTTIGELIKDTKEAVTSVSTHSKVLKSSSIQSAQSAEAVATASSEITKGTIEQTSEAEKTARQMVVLDQEIEVAATKFAEVEDISASTRNLSLHAKSIMELLIKKANETEEITTTISSDISELNKKSEEIKSITDLISNIAEQTNLLALNAAIEAARAQEMGLGFAVVAEEVNKLAERTETAAKTINEILRGVQAKAKSSTDNVAKANIIVMDQLKVVFQTQKSFDDIIQSMDRIVSRITDVNSHIKRINEVKDETTQATLNISAISEESAASSQEVTASIEEQTAIAEQVREMANELQTMAENLVAAISKFNI
jgi:methyl-accepting chemotaxis protein